MYIAHAKKYTWTSVPVFLKFKFEQIARKCSLYFLCKFFFLKYSLNKIAYPLRVEVLTGKIPHWDVGGVYEQIEIEASNQTTNVMNNEIKQARPVYKQIFKIMYAKPDSGSLKKFIGICHIFKSYFAKYWEKPFFFGQFVCWRNKNCLIVKQIKRWRK